MISNQIIGYTAYVIMFGAIAYGIKITIDFYRDSQTREETKE